MELWIAVIVVLASGAFLTAWGVRGRLINDHLICRKCGFDLLGLPSVAGRCPECGGGIRTARSVRRGTRRRRMGVIAIGVVILVVGGSGAGFLWYTAARAVNWNTYKPAWLLNRELRTSTPGTASAAGKELSARLANREVSRRRTRKIMDAVLDVQNDPSAPWDGDISGVLTDAREQGFMTNAQLGRFIRQSMSMAISIPLDLMVGEPIAVTHGVFHDATAHWMDTSVLVSYEVAVDGKPMDVRLPGTAPRQRGETMREAPCWHIPGFTNGVVWRGPSGTMTAVVHLVLDLTPGEHDVVIRLHNQGVSERALDWREDGAAPTPRAPANTLSSWIVEQTFHVRVRE